MIHEKSYLIFKCVVMLFAYLGFTSALIPQTTEAKEQQRLLIINSYNEGAPWSQELITPITMQTAQTAGVSAEIIHMNGTFIRNKTLFKQMEDGIFTRFENKRPDYLVLIGNMAFTLRDRIKQEWGDIPMILIGNEDSFAPNEYYYTGGTLNLMDCKLTPLSQVREQYNFAYIEIPLLYEQTIDMMVQMQPQIKKIVFIADELYTNRYLDRLVHAYILAKYPTLEYEWLVGNDQNAEHLQEYLVSRDLTIGLLFSTWFYERKNVHGFPTLISGDTRMISASPHPVFALRSAYLQDGVLGGYFPERKQTQEALPALVIKMLEGKSMRNIPFIYSTKSHPVVNYIQLVQDHLSIENCLPGTKFINKPKTLWQQYSWQIIIGIIILVSLIIVAVLNSLFQRKKLALFKTHNILVRNMPICYAQAAVNFNKDRHVTRLTYHSTNESFNTLTKQNTDNDQQHPLFPVEYISPFIETVFQKESSVTFTHYFKQTNTFYEFIICQSAEENVIDIFGLDVTSRSKAENALRESARKLDMTLSVARIIPWRWDLKNHKIACEVQRVLSHMNFTKQEGSTHSIHIIEESEYFQRIHPEDVTRVKQIHHDFLNGKLQYTKAEFRIVSQKAGKEHIDWLEINAAVSQCDNTGHPIALIGSLLLITERKKQEQALISAREKAKESDRLKSAFLANMSHEIRTPLNAIVGFSNLLTTTEDEEQKQQFIGIIENNNQLLLQLINDVLDLAKVESNTLDFNYQSTDLNELIRSVESTVRLRVQPGVILNFTLGAADCYIQTEPNRLSQVLINLLTNACKFTPKGCITFGYELQEDEIRFFVRDTGLGISQEGQKRIFERFTKLNDFAQGTGLGLSICKSIVEKMSGRIGVESDGEGKGSTFWFTIPYLTATTEESKPVIIEIQKECIKQKDITILIAEDNESNYLLFQSILGSKYKLIHAWNGQEAVELYQQHKPQIIIMDINMPKMDGYEATREIRKFSDSVPIIAVTAYAFASDKERIMKNGFNSYVSKPLNANKLIQELKTALNSSFTLV